MTGRTASRKVRVLYVATYPSDRYVRQEVVRSALRALPDVELVECVRNGNGFWRYVSVLVGFLRARPGRFDVVIIGFRGQEIVPFMRLITRTPIVFDAFISLYDTWCDDRRLFDARSLRGRFVRWYDRFCCKIVDRVVLDTDAHIEYFHGMFGVPREKFLRVFVGADESIYHLKRRTVPHEGFSVLFYGTYHPVHGTDVIIEAARALSNRSDIRFVLVGDGSERSRTEALSMKYGLKNVSFFGQQTQEQLADMIAQADICLGGHFSAIGKAQRVIAGKTFQFLAMHRVTIVSDAPGNRELLRDGHDCLMVLPGDSARLARAVTELCDDDALRYRIAEEGSRTFVRAKQMIRAGLRELLHAYGR